MAVGGPTPSPPATGTTSWYAKAPAGIQADLTAQRAPDDGEGSIDAMTGVEDLTGSRHHDLVLGGPTGNIISGGAGEDRIGGRGGDDRLSGGPGNDLVDGGGGEDACTGGPGRDGLTTCERSRE
jgi:Ca2+-binding RTX toxin-like protein